MFKFDGFLVDFKFVFNLLAVVCHFKIVVYVANTTCSHSLWRFEYELDLILCHIFVYFINLWEYINHFYLRRRLVWVVQQLSNFVLLSNYWHAFLFQLFNELITPLFCIWCFLLCCELSGFNNLFFNISQLLLKKNHCFLDF